MCLLLRRIVDSLGAAAGNQNISPKKASDSQSLTEQNFQGSVDAKCQISDLNILFLRFFTHIQDLKLKGNTSYSVWKVLFVQNLKI